MGTWLIQNDRNVGAVYYIYEPLSDNDTVQIWSQSVNDYVL